MIGLLRTDRSSDENPAIVAAFLEKRDAALRVEIVKEAVSKFNKCGCWNPCAGCSIVLPLIKNMALDKSARKS